MKLEMWKATREKGKKRFLWVNGFTYFGVSTAILWSLLMHIAEPVEPIWMRPLVALFLFPICGLAWGHFVWRASESKYNELSKKENS